MLSYSKRRLSWLGFSYSDKRVKDVRGMQCERESPTSLARRAALLGRGPHGRDLGGLYELRVVPSREVSKEMGPQSYNHRN